MTYLSVVADISAILDVDKDAFLALPHRSEERGQVVQIESSIFQCPVHGPDLLALRILNQGRALGNWGSFKEGHEPFVLSRNSLERESESDEGLTMHGRRHEAILRGWKVLHFVHVPVIDFGKGLCN